MSKSESHGPCFLQCYFDIRDSIFSIRYSLLPFFFVFFVPFVVKVVAGHERH